MTDLITTRIAEASAAEGTLRYRGVDVAELAEQASPPECWSLLTEHPVAAATGDMPATPAGECLEADVARQLAGALMQSPALSVVPTNAAPEDVAHGLSAAWHIACSHLAVRLTSHHENLDLPRDASDPTSAIRAALRLSAAQPAPLLHAYLCVAAEHGLNASTMAVRIATSAGASVGAALAAGLCTLSGARHGGAPALVDSHIDRVAEDPYDTARRALAAGERLPGFGHGVYRRTDPRAAILAEHLARASPVAHEKARCMEAAYQRAIADHHGRPLPSNLEFWAAHTLRYLGVPPHLFAGLFACARMMGWSAHLLEQAHEAPSLRFVATYEGPAPRTLTAALGSPKE